MVDLSSCVRVDHRLQPARRIAEIVSPAATATFRPDCLTRSRAFSFHPSINFYSSIKSNNNQETLAMSVKISVGLQKQVGPADCGSLAANCQVEFDFDGSLLDHDLDSLHQQMTQAFAVCQQAVNQQLPPQSAQVSLSTGHGHLEAVSRFNESSPSNGTKHGVGQATATATASQIRAIFGIARKQGVDPLRLVRDRFGVDRPDGLSIRQASALIDELKGSGSRSTNVVSR
jgi:hypothetical protein